MATLNVYLNGYLVGEFTKSGSGASNACSKSEIDTPNSFYRLIALQSFTTYN